MSLASAEPLAEAKVICFLEPLTLAITAQLYFAASWHSLLASSTVAWKCLPASGVSNLRLIQCGGSTTDAASNSEALKKRQMFRNIKGGRTTENSSMN